MNIIRVSARGVRTMGVGDFRPPHVFRKKRYGGGWRRYGPMVSDRDQWDNRWELVPWFSLPCATKIYPEQPRECAIDQTSAQFLGDQLWQYRTPQCELGPAPKEALPELIVPDLKDFELSAYVSYRADDISTVNEKERDDVLDTPPLTPRELFKEFYFDNLNELIDQSDKLDNNDGDKSEEDKLNNDRLARLMNYLPLKT